MKNKHDFKYYFKEYAPYVIIILVVVIIRSFIVTPVRVDGRSMDTTLENGQILLLNKLNHDYQRMDIIVCYYKGERLIKRVIGLPGETVEFKDNKLYINSKETKDFSDSVKTENFTLSTLGLYKVPQDHYFVVGDNRYDSADSRIIGPISKDDIVGTTSIRLFPFTKIGSIK